MIDLMLFCNKDTSSVHQTRQMWI